MAQTPVGSYAFTEGWVRLTLRPCPGVSSPPTRLLVEGATSFVAFEPGRAAGTTSGVLRSMGNRALLSVQRFPIRPESAGGRVVVLAPLEAGASPAAIKQVRLIAE